MNANGVLSLRMLEEDPERVDELIDENPDDIIGWNARRLHSADEFIAQKRISTALSLKTSDKPNKFPIVRNPRKYKIKPEAKNRIFNQTQILCSPNNLANDKFLGGKKIQNKLRKDTAEVHLKHNRLSPEKRLSEGLKPYQLFKSFNLEQFLTKTKCTRRRNSLTDGSSPVQIRYKKYNFLLNLFA